ncbi:malonate decarboxylase, alpha subunit [Thiomonas delicata]|uniref:Malonate decarboxylase, alpha subunit n=1 Tax=Thiomonas delicata TaxID=364030 RepID=A0A238D675_THIDL|nr:MULTISPECIES: malonate decarboxylase subunit alpha [Thiomonas]SBP88729.1 malonate decarboxylase, alpha subunit [Thiomonas delicata]
MTSTATPHQAGVRAPVWNQRRDDKARRLSAVAHLADGCVLPTSRMVEALELLLAPGDRVALEGNNQKQADFLSRSLARVDPGRIHGLHLLISSISRPEHLSLFEDGIARRVDFAFAGPQSLRVAQLLEDGKLEIGAIHTYVELYARMFIDLTPHVALVCADKADAQGNLYTGPNTEDTPTIVEATAFRQGIVIAQVNELVDALPRVDIPGSWVDFVVVADRPFAIEPLFTRDPRHITDLQVLMGMMAIRGIYERYQVTALNHGIGFDTAAIELLLPTYGASLGLKGKICRNWALNPHPTLIPAIESGWVESVHCFGSEVGMEDYIAARPDVFFVGRDGSMRSNRVLCQLAGQYGVDLFIGSTLQMDADANSSTVTLGRLTGFGGAPNMGHDPRGRRHPSPAWLSLITEDAPVVRGRKLVVQLVETYQKGGVPALVDSLDAVEVGKKSGMPIAPIMIYGDDVSHVVTEEGIAYLYKAQGQEERRAALAAVAGVTPIGQRADAARTRGLRERGIVAYPEDLGVSPLQAKRSLLAARSIEDLVTWSGGLYRPPARFRSW